MGKHAQGRDLALFSQSRAIPVFLRTTLLISSVFYFLRPQADHEPPSDVYGHRRRQLRLSSLTGLNSRPTSGSSNSSPRSISNMAAAETASSPITCPGISRPCIRPMTAMRSVPNVGRVHRRLQSYGSAPMTFSFPGSASLLKLLNGGL